MQQRLRHSKDLGETMVIAHAVVAAEAGYDVRVLLDDGGGARVATSEIRRLRRRQASDPTVGTISLVSTLTILKRAAGKQYLPGKDTMREIYARLRCLDDGLPPIAGTDLLSAATWRS